VKKVVSQVGRPDDGTDTGGFGNTEYFVDLKPHDQWRPVFHKNKEELIAAMNRAGKIPGRDLELLAAHRRQRRRNDDRHQGFAGAQDFRRRPEVLEQKGEEVTAVMSGIPGMHDVKLLRDFGQPNLDLTIDRRQAARFGINVADIQDAVQTAVGGNAVSQVLIGEQRYDVVVRYQAPYRNTQQAIEQRSPALPSGERVSLAQLTTWRSRTARTTSTGKATPATWRSPST
jgi:heavy metal efflux system protein